MKITEFATFGIRTRPHVDKVLSPLELHGPALNCEGFAIEELISLDIAGTHADYPCFASSQALIVQTLIFQTLILQTLLLDRVSGSAGPARMRVRWLDVWQTSAAENSRVASKRRALNFF